LRSFPEIFDCLTVTTNTCAELPSISADVKGAVMKNLFGVGVLLVLIVFALGAYWHSNPHLAPAFLRGALPKVELRGPTTPMVGFP
jgi:hypothetical protein